LDIRIFVLANRWLILGIHYLHSVLIAARLRSILGDRLKRFVCVSCLICLFCNVGVLWPNGWMDQDADDTKIYHTVYSDEDVSALQSDLCNLVEWSNE